MPRESKLSVLPHTGSSRVPENSCFIPEQIVFRKERLYRFYRLDSRMITRLPFAGLCCGWVVRSLSSRTIYIFTLYLRPLLVAHPLITARTPPLNRLRLFLFKLEYHVRLTCSHPNRENNTRPYPNQHLAFAYFSPHLPWLLTHLR